MMTLNAIRELTGIRGEWKLHYPYPLVPYYEPGRFGKWEIREHHPDWIKGYFSDRHIPRWKSYILANWSKQKPVTWMSLTPMELESHAMQIAMAEGVVGIGGLGLGMALFNILRKPEVEKVYVFEKERSIIKLLSKSARFMEWPGAEKLHIVLGDIKSAPIPPDRLDYLYVDIWEMLGDDRAVPDLKIICNRLKPRAVTWWGMEIDAIDYLKDAGTPFYRRAASDMINWRVQSGLPIEFGDVHEFLRSMEAVAVNMVEGGFV
jgi:hypothetical protein